ncbi:MAG: DUF4910 domain-containing protein [Bryobacterales bacterium]|nr:DUF4910 domain-containing protein [Bryobacterales bacterium]
MRLMLTLLLAGGWAQAATLDEIVAELRREVRDAEAMDLMRQVYANDRFFTFPRFEATARVLRENMTRLGLHNAEIVNAPADGVTQAGYWTMPLAWDVRSAKLEIAGGAVLADYGRVPASVCMWSGATGAEGLSAEVVYVRRGEAGRTDVRGKFALTEENPAGIKWLLVKGGAVGAINTFTENPRLEDGRQWINAWGDDGWAYTKRSTPLPCFSITPRETAQLQRLLAAGPVRVRATVDAKHYAGSYPYVTATLPGTTEEEVLTLGHTAEQGAHDNATGVSATIEALAALHRLIEAGRLPKPKRTIRVLSMGEMYGSLHYVASNPERVRRTVAALCLDTPAAAYELAGTEYSFYMNPHVAKDFTDALILKVAGSYLAKVRRPWHERDFATGTDTYMAEPMIGIPTVWAYSGSGVETHHNSEDTPDRVDARSLRDITIIGAAFLYYIANAGEEEAKWLAGLSETRGYVQILKAAEAGAGRIDYMLERESAAVRSVLRLVSGPRRDALGGVLEKAVGRLRAFAALQRERSGAGPALREQREAGGLIVKRKRMGSIPLDDLPHAEWEGHPSGAWASIPTHALYWCDGKRTLAEVARLTQLELGETDFDFVGYFRFLAKHGYVEMLKHAP